MTVAENIRVLIVDDHAIVREGQRALIDTEPGMAVVGEARECTRVKCLCNLRLQIN